MNKVLQDVTINTFLSSHSMWPPSSSLWLVLVLLVGLARGQGEHFEDADKSSEYTDQQFDLRHTIPGEPGLDYPILSAPPKTSFVCKGRHEGKFPLS